MGVDYRRQYPPEQLEPLFPHALMRGAIAALVMLCVLVLLIVMPVVLSNLGLHGWLEASEPADPTATPEHILPEWYFLAAYEALKQFPMEFLGVSGKTLGVMSEALVGLLLLILPYIVRRRSGKSRGWLHSMVVTAMVAVFLWLTIWGAWPASPLLLGAVGAVVIAFYGMMLSEYITLRRRPKARRVTPE